MSPINGYVRGGSPGKGRGEHEVPGTVEILAAAVVAPRRAQVCVNQRAWDVLKAVPQQRPGYIQVAQAVGVMLVPRPAARVQPADPLVGEFERSLHQ